MTLNLSHQQICTGFQNIKMYIARKKENGKICYYIRESYEDHGIMKSRDLFYLGDNPEKYIIYPGGNAYYIDEAVEDRLFELNADYDSDNLDDIFWDFVKPDIKYALSHFRTRGCKKPAYKGKSVSGDQFHIFDRRRIHFLRFAQMDQGYIGRVSPKLFYILNGKSRDEIEQYFLKAEIILKPRELKSYIFVIFDLQKHFSQSFAKTMPQALDQNAVDTFFIKEICNLNRDEKFWEGMEKRKTLNEYLIRYLIMFFDNEYGQSAFLEDILYNWMNTKRDFHFPKRRQTFTIKETATIFGVSEKELKKMSKNDLAKLFRKKAHIHHPDKGGDPETFIKLSQAYHDLKERKK